MGLALSIEAAAFEAEWRRLASDKLELFMQCAILLAVVFCLVLGEMPAYAAAQGVQHDSVPKNSTKNMGRLFEKADTNHDGVLTREEAEKIPVLSDHFNDMDINQDCHVTRQEMIASMGMKQRHHERNRYW